MSDKNQKNKDKKSKQDKNTNSKSEATGASDVDTKRPEHRAMKK